jgi:hypothetical protein
MPAASSPCPYCATQITPAPRRPRKCPECQRKVYPRAGKLLTEQQATGAQPPAPPAAPDESPAAPEGLRAVVAEVLRQLGAAPEEAARFARYQSFGSDLTPRETAFAQAAEFATGVGPARVISVSHAESERGCVVTVWYWGPPYEVQSEGP